MGVEQDSIDKAILDEDHPLSGPFSEDPDSIPADIAQLETDGFGHASPRLPQHTQEKLVSIVASSDDEQVGFLWREIVGQPAAKVP